VGIGWAEAEIPDDYFAALTAACERIGHPVPDRSVTNVYTIPQGPSLDPNDAYDADRGVFLVGDAAGVANRYQGEGIVQAIESSYLLADLMTEGREAEYPRALYREMRDEYRLANQMRGVWGEYHDTRMLATVAETIDGLTIEDITRNPRTVVSRVARTRRSWPASSGFPGWSAGWSTPNAIDGSAPPDYPWILLTARPSVCIFSDGGCGAPALNTHRV